MCDLFFVCKTTQFCFHVKHLIRTGMMFVQFGVKGVNRPYNPNYADENYSFEYGGYVDSKRQGFGGRGRGGFRGRSPMGFRGRYKQVSCVVVCPITHTI